MVPLPSSYRILLVGINYAPEQTGIGPYTTDLAQHLASQGHEVTVITGMPHYPEWSIQLAYRGRLRITDRDGDIDMRRVWHYVPSQQSAWGRGAYEVTFFAQALTARKLPRPDCVIGIVPSLSGGTAAALMARRYAVPFGLIFQDLVGRAATQSGIPHGGMVARPARAVEAWTARQADRTAIVAEAFRPYLQGIGVDPEKIVNLPNWSHFAAPTRSSDEIRSALDWDRATPVVLHAGNMGYKQDLGNVVMAARLAAQDGFELQFVLVGDGSERRRIEALAAGVPNLTFLGPQHESLFMGMLGAADVLLVNERATVLDMSLPSKITSYFCAGRPVVAAVPSGGTTSTELIESQGALVIEAGDPRALLEGIKLVIRDCDFASELIQNAGAYARARLDKSKLLERADELVRSLCGDLGEAMT